MMCNLCWTMLDVHVACYCICGLVRSIYKTPKMFEDTPSRRNLRTCGSLSVKLEVTARTRAKIGLINKQLRME